jgi:hypothetical protein
MQRVKAQIDCGAMSFFISPSLLRKLELPYEPAYTSPWPGDDVCQGKLKAKSFGSVFEHLKPVDELEVIVVPMKVYDLTLGLPCFKARTPEIDLSKGRLTALRAPKWTAMGEDSRSRKDKSSARTQ